MTDKRKHNRVDLLYYLKTIDRSTENYVGHLVDLSYGGFRMISKKPIKTDKEYHFEINLPDLINGQESLKVKAKSCWCTKDLNTDYYSSGFEFSGFVAQSIKPIQTLINSYELDSGVNGPKKSS